MATKSGSLGSYKMSAVHSAPLPLGTRATGARAARKAGSVAERVGRARSRLSVRVVRV